MENHPSNRASPRGRSGEATVIEIRKGQAPGRLERAEFIVRFRATFVYPTFRVEDESIEYLAGLHGWPQGAIYSESGTGLRRSGL